MSPDKDMDWRALCGEKLVAPEQALELIQPTDRVFIAGLQSTPFTLCRALIEKGANCAACASTPWSRFSPGMCQAWMSISTWSHGT